MWANESLYSAFRQSYTFHCRAKRLKGQNPFDYMIRQGSTVLAIAFALSGHLAAYAQSAAYNSSEILWYRSPAPVWDNALPIGNGRLGAMVFGGANTGANNGDLQDARANVQLMDGSETN